MMAQNLNQMVFAGIVIFYACVSVTSAIECYQCDTVTDDDCGDSWLNTFSSTSTTSYQALIFPCAYCTKAKVVINGNDFIQRDCLTGLGAFSVDHCSSWEHQGQAGHICLCDTNLCNSATDTQMSVFLLISTVMAAVLAGKYLYI